MRLIVLDVEPVDLNEQVDPGTVIARNEDQLAVQTGDGVVEITRLQPDGKREMTAAEFLRGNAVAVGDRHPRALILDDDVDARAPASAA